MVGGVRDYIGRVSEGVIRNAAAERLLEPQFPSPTQFHMVQSHTPIRFSRVRSVLPSAVSLRQTGAASVFASLARQNPLPPAS
jgi:hypothetical protein